MAIQEAMPDRLGPYRLLDRIGEGGMGVVHLAADCENRHVAVKVLRPQIAGDPAARRRLAREVETMRRVHSPFVAEVIDADVTGPVPYIVTRYVDGRTLEDVVGSGGPLRGLALQRLACGLALAVSAVHAAGVVHRDLKPGNVMMVGDEPVVIDFGIAQAGDTTRLTQTGMFVGTPGYLAPEVIQGTPSGQSSDVHSWGATVAFAATGRPPYGTGTYEVVFFRILHGGANLDGLPALLHPLVAAALSRDPAQRPEAAWLAGQVARLDLTAPAAAWHPGPAAAPTIPPVGRAGSPGAPGAGAAVSAPTAGGLAAAGAAGGFGGLGSGAAEGFGGGAGAGALAAQGSMATRQVADPGPLPAPQVAVLPPGADGQAGHVAAPPMAAAAARGLSAPAAAYAGPAYPSPAYQAPADVADLLPPVRYPAPPQAGRPAPRTGGVPAAGPASAAAARPGRPAPAPRRRRRMLALAALVMAVGVSVILPVAGTVLILAVIALLRAGDRAQSSLAVRRSVRGPRASDALVVALSAPWTLARSVLVALLVAPFAFGVASVVAVVAIIAARGTQLPVIGAYAAGVFTALSCLGPGSRAPRRQLNRVFNAIAPTRLAAVAAVIVLGSLAAALVSLAMIKAPAFWPVPDPRSLLAHLPGAHLFHGAVLRLRHATGGLARGVHLP